MQSLSRTAPYTKPLYKSNTTKACLTIVFVLLVSSKQILMFNFTIASRPLSSIVTLWQGHEHNFHVSNDHKHKHRSRCSTTIIVLDAEHRGTYTRRYVVRVFSHLASDAPEEHLLSRRRNTWGDVHLDNRSRHFTGNLSNTSGSQSSTLPCWPGHEFSSEAAGVLGFRFQTCQRTL